MRTFFSPRLPANGLVHGARWPISQDRLRPVGCPWPPRVLMFVVSSIRPRIPLTIACSACSEDRAVGHCSPPMLPVEAEGQPLAPKGTVSVRGRTGTHSDWQELNVLNPRCVAFVIFADCISLRYTPYAHGRSSHRFSPRVHFPLPGLPSVPRSPSFRLCQKIDTGNQLSARSTRCRVEPLESLEVKLRQFTRPLMSENYNQFQPRLSV